MMRLVFLALLVHAGCLPQGEKRVQRKPLPTPNQQGGAAVSNGPGFMDSSFVSSASFVKVTATPLATTQHGEGQGRNAEIWYSANIRPLFGTATTSGVPEGTVAIKKFLTADNQVMITGMVKKGGSWQYYMGPQSPFPTTPVSSNDAQMCIGCHQSTGALTDLLPYLPHAQATSGSQGSNGANDSIQPSLQSGPGTLSASFKTNSQFVKVTKSPLAFTQHEGGQGKNANIWYSTNIQAVFGRSAVQSVPTGTVAIKEFQTPDNKTMITGMVKTSSGWQYYMGPPSPFPTTPMPASDAQMCVSCHQSTGQPTDLLPYLPRASL
ncbi:MAG: hypothetical protein AB7T49_19705 [Oligoflexales bacterium]